MFVSIALLAIAYILLAADCSASTAASPQKGSLCGCDDSNVYSSKLWLDVVLVFDSSDAMSENGRDAWNTMLPLITRSNLDTTKEKYIRFGIVVYGETAHVQRNLSDNFPITPDYGFVKMTGQPNIAAGVEMAQQLFLEAPKRKEDARQVIILVSSFYDDKVPDSNPRGIANWFKEEDGIIIVYKFGQSQETTDLLDAVASYGYEVDSLNDPFQLLDDLCAANCFCNSDGLFTPYTINNDPRFLPDGGCYKVASSQTTASFAKSTCAIKSNSILLTIEDENKQRFALQIYADSVSVKTQQLWLGLSRSSNNSFVWADGSPLTYANWSSGQPGMGDCAYVLLDGRWFSSSCNKYYEYICQSVPCSVDKLC